MEGLGEMTSEIIPPLASATDRPAVFRPLSVQREHAEGMYLATLQGSLVREMHLTLVPKEAETLEALIGRLAEFLKSHHLTVLRQFVFGSVAAYPRALRVLRRMLGEVDWPITWVEGGGCSGSPIGGIQIHAVAGAHVRTLAQNGRIVGRIFDDGQAQHCVLGDLGPTRPALSATDQVRETFENLEAALAVAGMNFKDMARTWLFLDDILSWYGPFNAVRNEFFARNELRPGSFPASTGVSGKNPRGTALVAGAWAVRPHQPAAHLRIVPSPKQCPAPAYGSAFSRAVEIGSPQHRIVLVSGTASIAPDGRTLHVRDIRRQIDLTMEVVSAILMSRSCGFADVIRATAYFKSPADAPLFREWCARNGLEEMPVVSAHCDICRDDLLFEIELDALNLC